MLEKRLSGMSVNALLPSEQQLADEFGVSKPTLRRALQHLVDTGALRKINGVGTVVAREVRALSKELIFLCADLTFFAESLKSFAVRASAGNYFVSIVPLAGDAQSQELTIHGVIERCPAGVAVYADPANCQLPAFHEFGARSIPTVYITRLPRGIDGNLAEFGNTEGMTEVVERRYAEGCRRIAFYADRHVNSTAASEREQGFLAGLRKCRIKPRSELICGHDVSDSDRDAFLDLFAESATRPDAVCCANDNCAASLVMSLQRRGIEIRSLCLAGFDHSPLSEFMPVSFLTVSPPLEMLGTVAAETLIRHIENPGLAFQRRFLNVRLVEVKP